ncbi:MAG: cbb3-type cytochrome c oxidase subunit 3 [Hyphomonadaceae bacterium]|nr:cbb3-type cytochrome c oxidase subunit 3 [Hyphomonadaceae bacterium]
MTYENWSRFAQDWGTVYFVVIFLIAVGYALWPRNASTFKRAAHIPITEQEQDDDRPLT